MKNLTILLIASFFITCSKPDLETNVFMEKDITPITGLSISNSIGFKADRATFKLKIGSNPSKEYGQSLSNNGITKLPERSYIIHNIELYDENNVAIKDYNSYTIENGKKRKVAETSLIMIKKDSITYIYLEKLDR